MNWLFVGPNVLSGIGQVCLKYAKLVENSEYVVYNEGKRPSKNHYDVCFAFVLPLKVNLDYVDSVKHLCGKVVYMTVCETEPVHECYGMLKDRKPLYTPSVFAKNILDKQFGMDCKVLRHWTPLVSPTPAPKNDNYVFYTIGNILDPRKNIKGLLSAFQSLNLPNARLVLKATCKQAVNINIPNVVVINGLLPEDQLEKIHTGCHCYINCSHSEGVGMGAVEAAIRDKPVIITDYGGLKEYVKTPYVIPCTLGRIGFNDFLFEKDSNWGHPKLQDIKRCMEECYAKRLRHMDHEYTKNLLTQVQNDLVNIAKKEL